VKRLGEEDVTTANVNAYASVNAPQATPAGSDAPSTVFAGLRFLLRGETDTANVRSIIENAGGFIVRADADADADYIIVRLVRCARTTRRRASGTARSAGSSGVFSWTGCVPRTSIRAL
jgi:hypothetical protein